jgi:DHA2 family multidrug resistance protein
MVLNGVALWQMMHFDLTMGIGPFIISGVFQGLGIGLIFVPLSTLAFATIPPHLRGEGSSVYTLIRNLGGSAGISIMAALLTFNTQAAHSAMTPSVDPSNPVLRSLIGPDLDARLQALNGEITRQAAMMAYLDDFKLMLIITIACLPMLLLMRVPKRKAKGPVHVEID